MANFNCLTEEEYKEFSRRYPAAEAFLTARSLEHEWVNLHREAKERPIDVRRLSWITDRIAELSHIFDPSSTDKAVRI